MNYRNLNFENHINGPNIKQTKNMIIDLLFQELLLLGNSMAYPAPNLRKNNGTSHLFRTNFLEGGVFGKKKYPLIVNLNIENCQLKDEELSILQHYPGLRSLCIKNSGKIANLSYLSHCPFLKSLIIKNSRVESVHGIEYCPELETLEFYNTKSPDLSLASGSKLIEIIYRDTDRDNDTNCNIGLLNLPVNLPNLISLYCESNTLEYIPGYPNLEELKCTNCGKIKEIGPCPNLLYLSCIKCGKIKEIGSCPKLVRVDCGGNQLTNLEFLRGAPIATLNCADNRITDLSPLYGAPINVLDCANNRITDLNPLYGSPIENLLCQNNHITKLCPMPCLWNLVCSGNKIFRLTELFDENMGSEKLYCIDCSDNRLISLQGLESCHILHILDAQNNDIFDINALKDLDKLEDVKLANNMIMFLPQMKLMKKQPATRCQIDFRFNMIEEISHLRCNRIVRCDFAGNPLSSSSRKCLASGMTRGFHASRILIPIPGNHNEI
jgi:Leucine-rich repeat (LRR) protein